MSALSVWWAVPFVGLLLSIAFAPLAMPGAWHRHHGKIVAAWMAALLAPQAFLQSTAAAVGGLAHALVAEYVPFILLLTSLYVVAGGIHVRGNLRGSAAMNTAILAIGALLANLMGTTGASMLLIRPLLRANDKRRSATHVVVFFIFIVANAGGSLTPLGDPPLFLGFLQGVPFFWTTEHLLAPAVSLVAALLVVFFVIDAWKWKHESRLPIDPTPDSSSFGFDGCINFALLVAVMGLVLMSGLWKSASTFDVAAAHLSPASIARDVGLLVVIGLSLWLTPAHARQGNRFGWGPMAEVAKLFVGIFVTIGPVIAMLQAGASGPFVSVVALVTRADGTPNDLMYFWATGLLSSFLDNAPTYLVFFNTAGGSVSTLTTTLASTLAAISAGAVFMGANTYIGNAPNLMVKAIAEERGVAMPNFFGYMAWSGVVLVPLLVAVGLVFFQ
ncbi:MAG: sodium:proton antiporter [Rhizobacter sp.]|nr:sodium:proton antiporter [Rhizobacter sp.]